MKRGSEDETIVNPERLSARKASDVCGRCHSILSHQTTDTWQGQWNDFRPGELLESRGRVVMHPESADAAHQQVISEHARLESGRFPRDRFWEDGAVRVAGRELNDVVSSPCYGGGEFSCLSCHSMHNYESAADQLKQGMSGDKACVQCHPQFDENISAHTFHEPDSPGSRCANCHMPYTTYGLLKAIRSHRVSSPNVEAEIETGRPNACNACHLDQSLAWTQTQLERDFRIAPIALSEVERDVASGPRWIATGDAGVRALVAWYAGWKPAQEASGRDWMAPYLAELLADRYSAVRNIAATSLRDLPNFAELEYDFVEATGAVGARARENVRVSWQREVTPEFKQMQNSFVDGDGRFNSSA